MLVLAGSWLETRDHTNRPSLNQRNCQFGSVVKLSKNSALAPIPMKTENIQYTM